MRNLISDDPMWEAFAERAVTRVPSGGADFGEILATVAAVGDGGADTWCDAWQATAERVADIAEACAATGHTVSARQAWLRACTYHQVATMPLYALDPDPRVAAGFARQTETFEAAVALAPQPVIPLEIPFEEHRMQGYLCLVDDSGAPRPTIVHVNGYDGTVQEMYMMHVPAALERGYNIMIFDGPGQGRMLIRDGVRIRPDWEHVVTAAIDHIIDHPEVDTDRIVLAGWSFGGYLAPRAACFEHRIAALVADPGQWDQRDNLSALPLSPEQVASFPEGVSRSALAPLEDFLRSPEAPAALRWRLLGRGPFVHGVPSLFDLFADLTRYELSSCAHQISCPAFLAMPEGDMIAAGAPKLAAALGDQATLVPFTEAEGAAGHCESLARSLYHQRMYDWLDETLKS